MTMTRKDYRLLAKALCSFTDLKEREKIGNVIGAHLKDDNPHFDWSKWLTALEIAPTSASAYYGRRSNETI